MSAASIHPEATCKDGLQVRTGAERGQLFGNSESFDWIAAVNEAETRTVPIAPALNAARAGASALFGHETDFATKFIHSRILNKINMLRNIRSELMI